MQLLNGVDRRRFLEPGIPKQHTISLIAVDFFTLVRLYFAEHLACSRHSAGQLLYPASCSQVLMNCQEQQT